MCSILGYVTGWTQPNKNKNKEKSGGRQKRVYVIVVPGHYDDKLVQLLVASTDKTDLHQKLLRKFNVPNEFPIYKHELERGVFHIFKRSPAVYSGCDGYVAHIEVYDKCWGFQDSTTRRSNLSKKTHWRSGKKSTLLGLKIYRHLIENDDTDAMVIFICI